MIPQFPEFKDLEITDKAEIERYTNALLPYSDFDFVSMWSWNTSGSMALSLHDKNLVIRFKDYVTNEVFFTFLGNSNVTETATAILAYAKDTGVTTVLKLLPEEVASKLDTRIFTVAEDRNNFDYVYDLHEWSVMEGGPLARKRNEVNALLAAYPNAEFRSLDLRDADTQAGIRALFQKWIDVKVAANESYETNEVLAFERLMQLADSCEFVSSGLFLDGKLAAFCISEIMHDGYAVGHVAKADVSIKGTNASVMKHLASLLCERGLTRFNYEQDLGLENLRQAKERFRPVSFLKKYTAALA